MLKFAFLSEDNLVVSVTEWDGVGIWEPVNQPIVVLPPTSGVEAGWKYVATTHSFLEPAPLPEAPDGIHRIEKIDFMRLFTTTETVRYKMVRMAVDALTEADYVAAMTGDQMKLMLVSAGVMFDRFDLASQLELDHPETVQGIQLLAAAGVFGTVGEGPGQVTAEYVAERTAHVMAGMMPEVVV